MAQNNEVFRPLPRYTRTDFTALRAWLNRLPTHQISSLYYTEDDLEALACSTDSQLQARLEALRDHLIRRASEQNPHLAEMLKNARQHRLWAPKLVSYLVQAGEQEMTQPRPQDPVSAWFKTPVSAVLHAEEVRTLGDLISLIQVRGAHWWLPLPRIGAGKAASILAWLSQHAASLGSVQTALLPVTPGELILLSANDSMLAPIERILLPAALDGRVGRNRHTQFCLIAASNDYQAIEAYLTKFRHQEKTRRAYQKEIERFLLWCITVRQTALSSVLQDDCEAYKDFLAQTPAHWIGPRVLRSDPRWRPFAGPLSAASQRYATQAVRFFFNWLVNVRYLGGNPWATVSNPAVATALHPLQIDKALPASLWDKLAQTGGILDQLCAQEDAVLQQRYRLRGAAATHSMAAQFRLVRAALLLIGDTGLRREEATYATRDKLKPIPGNEAVWELDVLGKRNKWRTVFPSQRAVNALKAHWHDRNADFMFGLAELPLLSPLSAPPTQCASAKHHGENGAMLENGFCGDGLYRVITTACRRIAVDEAFDLTATERAQLLKTAPHALRHTFGTHAVAGEVPIDIVQKVLGHASLQTTTIYVQAEKKRSIEQLGHYFTKT